ncbi:MAG TPA: hypothetical protein VN541_01550 [Tepidisphaeraceae bacterium]|nr:hypothetical protein [Tepidisphaeraceae bacterium]
MSRTTPPPHSMPAGSPQDPNKRPQAAGPSPAARPVPPVQGQPAVRPGITTPKAPTVGASAPPTAGGIPANKVPPRPAGAVPGARPAAPGAKPAGPGAPGGAAPAANGGDAQATVPIAELKGRPIGRVLTKMGKVTREQVVEALDFQKRKGGALGRILIDLGYIKELDLNFALAAQRGYELINLEGKQIAAQAISAVPPQIATTNKVLPLEFDPASKKLKVAMANPENFRALDDLRSLMGYDVTAVLADPEQIDKLVAKHYTAAAENISEILSELSTDDALKGLKDRGESIDLDSIKEAADSNPVRKLINLVLLQAIKDKASDIHF